MPLLQGLTHVVIHHSAGPPSQTFEEIERFHTTPTASGGKGFLAIGYHVVILPDGRVRHGRRLPVQGAHAPNPVRKDVPAPSFNATSIGVCLIGDNTVPGREWTAEQVLSLRRYLDALDKVAPGLTLLGHRDTGKATECPGIDRGKLLSMLGR